MAEITRAYVRMVDAQGASVTRPARKLDVAVDSSDKGSYRHFMLKEIYEQPHALVDILQGRFGHEALLEESLGFKAGGLLKRIRNVHIVACGTSSHAGEVARYWLERLARIPCNVELASEYRYRDPVVPPNCLFVALSQSGETADTLAALRHAKQAGYLATLAVCNVPESSLTRESDMQLLTRAGPEIGVASTKAFTTQLMAMLMLTVLLARRRWKDGAQEATILHELTQAGARVEQVLRLDKTIASLAERLADKQHALFLGRGPLYPIAKEGALKLKEISYIHAEAYAAGELKHGPLALVDKDMPVVVVAPSDAWLEKVKSNICEVRARGGELFVFTDKDSGFLPDAGMTVILLPKVSDLISPILCAVALQLLAYHVAVARGTDVDQPRNLAKSVTVE